MTICEPEERHQFFIEYFLTLTVGLTVSVLDWSRSDMDERQQPDKNKLQLIVRMPGAKLEDLNTCNDIITKHKSAMLKTISELEQVSWMCVCRIHTVRESL